MSGVSINRSATTLSVCMTSLMRSGAYTTKPFDTGWGGWVRASTLSALLSLSMGLASAAEVDAAIVRHTNIAAQPLEAALESLARERGFQLVYRAGVMHDLRTAGASGDLTLDEALNSLLGNTGLTYRYVDEKTITVMPAHEATSFDTSGSVSSVKGSTSSFAMNAVNAEGWARLAQSSPNAAAGKQTTPVKAEDGTEEVIVTGQYVQPAAMAGKVAESLRQIPQSVSVITQQRLEDQNIHELSEALKFTTGITVRRIDASGAFNSFHARGYDSSVLQLDGLTVPTDGNRSYFDMAMYERVEVQRGAAGLFQGAGEPGVTINLARKRALAPFQTQYAVSAGSWDNYRGDIDITGALTKSERIRGRFVAAVNDFDTYMDGIDGEKKFGYGTLEFSLTDSTNLSVGAAYQEVQGVQSWGLPAWPGGRLLDELPRSATIVFDWSGQSLRTKDVFAELEQHFQNGSYLKVAARQYERSNRAMNAYLTEPNAQGDISTLYMQAQYPKGLDRSLDVFYNLPLHFANQEHKLLVGADYRTSETDRQGSRFATIPGAATNILIRDPAAVPTPAWPGDQHLFDEQESYGVYGRVHYKPLSALTLIGGGRMSWWDSTRDNVLTGARMSAYEQEGEFTPYAAAVLDVSEAFSVYASYAEIFQPQNNLTFTGEQIDPRTGGQIEAGVKAEFLDKRLNAHMAIYRLQDENRAVADALHQGFFVAQGKIRSEGFESTVVGQLAQNWNVTAGYAYTTIKYIEATAAEKRNQSFTLTPKHNFNIWTHYRFAGQILSGLELGVGLRAVSEYYSENFQGIRLQSDGYTIASLQAGYRLSEKYKIALNVENAFDKKYWERLSSLSDGNFYGSPRSVVLTLRGKW